MMDKTLVEAIKAHQAEGQRLYKQGVIDASWGSTVQLKIGAFLESFPEEYHFYDRQSKDYPFEMRAKQGGLWFYAILSHEEYEAIKKQGEAK